jgi:PAS domain S-box-containing protein
MVAIFGFARLWRHFWTQRPILRPIFLSGKNGRYHLHLAPTTTHTPYYNMTIANRDAVVNSMNDGMIVLDNQKRIIDVNPSARRIIRKSQTDLLGKLLHQACPLLAAQFQAAEEGPLDIAIDMEEKRFFEFSITPFRDERQEQRGHLLTLRDVTERKRLENMRDDLTRTMVHDLRDPISNSLFALEMLKTTLLEGGSAETQQLLDLTFASTAKTLQLVDKILEIGRLENGEMPLTPTSFSLAEMVQTVLAAQTPRAANRQLQLVNNVPESLPLAWADAELLERVLKNLVDNSIKFTPIGGKIGVTAVTRIHDETNEPVLYVSVSDTGPGIAAELRPRIFDQFATGAHVESGSGLGLAFCKMALTAHGEDIWVASEPGEGTILTFSLSTAPADS